MSLPFLILGAGGHGSVLAETLFASGQQILGFLDPDVSLHGKKIMGLPVLGDEALLASYPPATTTVAIGIGSTSSTVARRALYEKVKAAGYSVAPIRHPQALLADSAEISEGTQLLAGVIIQSRALIGENTICNSGAIIEHDCRIGSHGHIAPGSVLSGFVRTGDGCHIGVGATVIQGVSIGRQVTVGAGAVVLKDIPDGEVVVGNPAKKIGYASYE